MEFNGKKYFVKSSKIIYDIYSIEDKKVEKYEVGLTRNYRRYLYNKKLKNLELELDLLKNKIEKFKDKYDIMEYLYKSKIYYKLLNQEV